MMLTQTLIKTKAKKHKIDGTLKIHHRSQRPAYNFSVGPYRLELARVTKIMGVINLTPDSFSHDGCLLNIKNGREAKERAFHLAEKMIYDGADIIDVGGESTRPESMRISIKEEIARVIPTIRLLAKRCTVPISVDSYKGKVVQSALDAGALIVNNIMGTTTNKSLLKMVNNYDAGIVLMHIRGTPNSMQKNIEYGDLCKDIIQSLNQSIENCLEAGIKRDKIIIDPGIGFGKTVAHNLQILNRLRKFQTLRQPLLIGPSRKSFIGKILSRDVSYRILGTGASITTAILNGAHIVRVHDVKAMKEIVTMTDAILNEGDTFSDSQLN